MALNAFDFIIIGAGSAGCVVAARLSENPSLRVLLLEAGPKDVNPWIHVPIGYAKMFLNEKYNWKYKTDPEPTINGRQIYWPRGKTLGGSSSINGLIYVRGLPFDFDAWRQLGNAGWDYESVLPYFRKAESNARGHDHYHGRNGPLVVGEAFWRNELSEAYIDAAVEWGLPRNDDFNGADQEGVGYYQLTQKNGRRCSTARGYLAPVLKRPNLEVITGAMVEGLDVDGRRVTGVRYRVNGRRVTVNARSEIVLCAGTIGSPQILQLSGIGPGELLAAHGIAVKHELPGVGENLQDHYQCKFVYRVNRPLTLNDTTRSLPGMARMGLQYLVNRTGPLSIGAAVAGAFVRSHPEVEDPDIQLLYMPFSTSRFGVTLDRMSGFSVSATQQRPESRGYVRIRSADPNVHPSMVGNYLAAEADQRAIVDGLKILRGIGQMPALSRYIVAEEMPGPNITSDEELLDYARATGGSGYHPIGSCRMAPDHDRLGVVDEKLRLRGLTGLRVADGSIMPTMISGNTNAACVMIGEKCADMIQAELR